MRVRGVHMCAQPLSSDEEIEGKWRKSLIEKVMNKAVTRIQSHYRGHRSRRSLREKLQNQ